MGYEFTSNGHGRSLVGTLPAGSHHPEEGSHEEVGHMAVCHWHKDQEEGEDSRGGMGHRSGHEEGEEGDSLPWGVGEATGTSLFRHSTRAVGFGRDNHNLRHLVEGYSLEEGRVGRSRLQEEGMGVVQESEIVHDRVRVSQAGCQQHTELVGP